MANLVLGSSAVASALSRPDLAANSWASDVAQPPMQGYSGQSVSATFDLGNTVNLQGRISLVILGGLVIGIMAFTLWSRDYQR